MIGCKLLWSGENKDDDWEEGNTFDRMELSRETHVQHERFIGATEHHTYSLIATDGMFSGHPGIELSIDDMIKLRDAIDQELKHEYNQRFVIEYRQNEALERLKRRLATHVLSVPGDESAVRSGETV